MFISKISKISHNNLFTGSIKFNITRKFGDKWNEVFGKTIVEKDSMICLVANLSTGIIVRFYCTANKNV